SLVQRTVPADPRSPQPRRPNLRSRREPSGVLPVEQILNRDRRIYRRPQLLPSLYLDASESAHSLCSRVQVILKLRTVTSNTCRQKRPFSLIPQLRGTLISRHLWKPGPVGIPRIHKE